MVRLIQSQGSEVAPQKREVFGDGLVLVDHYLGEEAGVVLAAQNRYLGFS